MASYPERVNLRILLARKGFTVSAAERAAGMAQGSLSRILCGRRGARVPVDTVRRVADGTCLSFSRVTEALELSIAQAIEGRQRRENVERARLAAELQ